MGEIAGTVKWFGLGFKFIRAADDRRWMEVSWNSFEDEIVFDGTERIFVGVIYNGTGKRAVVIADGHADSMDDDTISGDAEERKWENGYSDRNLFCCRELPEDRLLDFLEFIVTVGEDGKDKGFIKCFFGEGGGEPGEGSLAEVKVAMSHYRHEIFVGRRRNIKPVTFGYNNEAVCNWDHKGKLLGNP